MHRRHRSMHQSGILQAVPDLAEWSEAVGGPQELEAAQEERKEGQESSPASSFLLILSAPA